MKLTRFQINEYEVLVVPVLYDNFSYLVCRDGKAVLIDAGEARPVMQVLKDENLQLVNIFITHTHHDHVGGCRALQDQLSVQSVSPSVESKEYSVLGTVCRSILAPGHMAVHKLYYFPELDILFTGDTIINGACGRILGGTAEQYFASLQAICALPDQTVIFGGHDYLVANMEFASSIDPDNADIDARLELYRKDPTAAIFMTLADEKKSNPFLRVGSAEEFMQLREQKDRF